MDGKVDVTKKSGLVTYPLGDFRVLSYELLVLVTKELADGRADGTLDRVNFVFWTCKGLRFLSKEQSIWGSIEATIKFGKNLCGLLARTVVPQLPMNCIKILKINSDRCTKRDIIDLLETLQHHGHTLSSLNISGSSAVLVLALSKIISITKIPDVHRNLRSLFSKTHTLKLYQGGTERKLQSGKLVDVIAAFPQLENLNTHNIFPDSTVHQIGVPMLTRLSQAGSEWRADQPSLIKTLIIDTPITVRAMGRLGKLFPRLEVFQGDRLQPDYSARNGHDAERDTLQPLCYLRHLNATYDGRSEGEIAVFFVHLLKYSPGLETIFLNYSGSSRLDLFKAAKTSYFAGGRAWKGFESPKLQYACLTGWYIEAWCMVGEKRIWNCPRVGPGGLVWT